MVLVCTALVGVVLRVGVAVVGFDVAFLSAKDTWKRRACKKLLLLCHDHFDCVWVFVHPLGS